MSTATPAPVRIRATRTNSRRLRVSADGFDYVITWNPLDPTRLFVRRVGSRANHHRAFLPVADVVALAFGQRLLQIANENP
jgi:hypothetical protein